MGNVLERWMLAVIFSPHDWDTMCRFTCQDISHAKTYHIPRSLITGAAPGIYVSGISFHGTIGERGSAESYCHRSAIINEETVPKHLLRICTKD